MNKKEKQKALHESYKSIDDLYDYIKSYEEFTKDKSRFKPFKYGVQDMQKKFMKWYELFYENDDNFEGFNEAVSEFDERMKEKSFVEIVKYFNKGRMDLISSDREAAAFMFALKEMAVC